MKIFSQWLVLCSRFDALIVRERILLFGSCLAGVYLIFDTLFILPAKNQLQNLTDEITDIQKNIDQISTEKQVFDRVSQRDPDANLKRERLKLQGRLLQLESGLNDLSLRLISMEQFPEIIREISKSTGTVKLISLQTLPPEVIDLSGKVLKLQSIASTAKGYFSQDQSNKLSEKNTAPAEKVYRHAIRIRVAGQYFEIMSLLKTLENLKWRFYWEGLHYRVTSFPQALVDVELYMISTDEGILGGG